MKPLAIRARRNPQAGMTLLEMMIAVTLVSMLSVGMLMSLRMGLRTMEKVDQRLYDNRRVISVNRILDSQIAGLMPVAAECMASGQLGPRISFFQGEPQSMRFVSSFSMQEGARGYPRILEYRVIPGEEGGFRLIVNELLFTPDFSVGQLCIGMAPHPLLGGQLAPQFVPIQPGPNSFVLADKLQGVRFLFRESLKEPPYERWLPVWAKNDALPSAIRIELASLPSEQVRLPLVSVTAPVRVTKEPLGPYTDMP